MMCLLKVIYESIYSLKAAQSTIVFLPSSVILCYLNGSRKVRIVKLVLVLYTTSQALSAGKCSVISHSLGHLIFSP